MSKKLISERTVIDSAKKGEKTFTVDAETIITDTAHDRAKQLGIRFVRAGQATPEATSTIGASIMLQGKQQVIAIGSDHGGFPLKQSLKSFLDQSGYKIIDLGTFSEEACDYPDYAYAVARMVSIGDASKGIMIDAVGNASAIVANKIKRIRAACCYNEFSARSSREHNDANILTLGGRVIGAELAKSIVQTWLGTSFAGGRHQVRIDKIIDIEDRIMR
jgi:ribose 5-phosphate isomerase B